jgi:2-polyprenyl-3-methyl-5-hydroxy-6-metoxy-1,4-benzoquinol methylase
MSACAQTSRLLSRVIERVAREDDELGARLQTIADDGDPSFHTRAENFLHRYKSFMESQGKSFEFGIDCFVRLQLSLDDQRMQFLRTGRYQNSSFDEVNRCVYSNPEVMQYHMHGLVFAQFLWPDQYWRFRFFADNLPGYRGIKRYLEVGGGHALYVTEAARVFGDEVRFDVVDISPTSLAMAKAIADEPKIHYHLMNIFDFPDEPVYDFITMGEVVEHVEQPAQLLNKVRRLLTPGGSAYITTPANAPMLDHIYLFRNAQEIRDMLTDCGFRIERETRKYAVPISEEMAAKLKTPLMYAAFVTPA